MKLHPAVNVSAIVNAESAVNLESCDTECHDECFSLKRMVDTSVMLECARERCNCKYSLALPIEE